MKKQYVVVNSKFRKFSNTSPRSAWWLLLQLFLIDIDSFTVQDNTLLYDIDFVALVTLKIHQVSMIEESKNFISCLDSGQRIIEIKQKKTRLFHC